MSNNNNNNNENLVDPRGSVVKVMRNIRNNSNINDEKDNININDVEVSVIKSRVSGSPIIIEKTNITPKSRSALSALIIVYFAVFIDMLGNSIVIPILPFWALKFNASPTMIGVLFGSYAATSFLGTLVFGRLSDRIGRRPLILSSLFGSCFGALGQGLSTSIEMLIIVRAATGLFGGSPPIAQAYIADVTTIEERPKFLALMGAIIASAFLFGPGLGAGLAQFGLEVPLFVASGFAFIGLIFGFVFLKEPRQIKKKKNDNDDIEMNSKSSNNESNNKTSSQTSVVDDEDDEDEKKKKAAVLQTETRKKILIALICGGSFLQTFAFVSFSVIFGIFSEEKYGWTSLNIGFVFSGLGLVFMFNQAFLFPRLLKIIPLPVITMIGAFVLGLGLFIIPLPSRAGFALIGVFLMGFGQSLMMPAIPSLLTTMASKENQGRILSYGTTSNSAARVVAPFILGSIYEVNRNLPFFVTGIIGWFAALIFFFLTISWRKHDREKILKSPAVVDQRVVVLEPTSEDIHSIGHYLSKLLMDRGYVRWAHPKNVKGVYTILQSAFPPLRESPKEKMEDVRKLLSDAELAIKTWNRASAQIRYD